MRLKNSKKKLVMIMIFLVPLLIIQTINFNNDTDIINGGSHNLGTSADMAVEYYYNIPWLSNGDFSSQGSWYLSQEGGDSSDISQSISGGTANFIIKGEEKEFSEISGTPKYGDWNKTNNPYFSAYPDYSNIISGGMFVSHYFNEEANQNPAVRWERIVTLDDDMSNYDISSVSLDIIVNATVTTDGSDGIEGIGDIDKVADYKTGDYIRFTAWISDVDNKNRYRVAWNQTHEALGDDGTSGIMENTRLNTVSQNDFIRYLTSVLSTDNHQFKIIIEIRIHCEDNIVTNEADRFDSIYINEVNLSFTYVNRVNALTKASWNQDGPTFSSVKYNETNNITLLGASLTFNYRISESWPTSDSPNTQIIIFINNNQNPITTYLEKATTGWRTETFNVMPLISVGVDYVNFTIQLYLGDTFGLNRPITVYIDNVNLMISYQEIGIIKSPPPGIDWTPATIILSLGILAALMGLVAYVLYFQFPPLVRKVRSLRRKIKRGRSLKKPVEVENRETLIKKAIKEQLDVLKIEPRIDKAIPPMK